MFIQILIIENKNQNSQIEKIKSYKTLEYFEKEKSIKVKIIKKHSFLNILCSSSELHIIFCLQFMRFIKHFHYNTLTTWNICPPKDKLEIKAQFPYTCCQ